MHLPAARGDNNHDLSGRQAGSRTGRVNKEDFLYGVGRFAKRGKLGQK